MVALQLQSPPLIDDRPARSRAPDFVSVIEAAYGFETNDRDWLHRIMTTASPLLNQGYGIAGWLFRVAPDGGSQEVREPIFLGCPAGFPEAISDATRAVESQVMARQYVHGPLCNSISNLVGRSGTHAAEVVAERCGVRDGRLLRVDFDPLEGAMFCVPVERISPFPSRSRPLLGCVAAHIAAAKRLRDALRLDPENGEPSPGVVFDAILDERGRVVHAEGDATATAHRSALGEAASDIAHARGKLRRHDPARAIELWRALVAGRWSLVHHLDTDGRRLLLARQNPPLARDPLAVSEQERLVLSLVARGHTVKVVAYELGITPAAVSARLSSGLKKLGLRHRSELVRLMSSGSGSSGGENRR